MVGQLKKLTVEADNTCTIQLAADGNTQWQAAIQCQWFGSDSPCRGVARTVFENHLCGYTWFRKVAMNRPSSWCLAITMMQGAWTVSKKGKGGRNLSASEASF